MKGHETPENQSLTILKGFSTVSEEVDRKASQPLGHGISAGERSKRAEIIVKGEC
jgi:hypothetical protein